MINIPICKVQKSNININYFVSLNGFIQLSRSLIQNNFTSNAIDKPKQKALLLGAFNRSIKTDVTLSPIAQRYMGEINVELKTAVNHQMGIGKGEVRVFDNLRAEFRPVAEVGMGPDPGEEKDDKIVFQRREFIRDASGARALQARGM